MASTIHRNIAERLSRQGRWTLRPRRFHLAPSSWLHLRSLSWRRLLRRLPLYAGLVVAAGALALVLAASAPRLFGYHSFIVYGGSMAPALRAGDVALTKPVAAEDVQVGDIIATRPNAQASPLLHRVTAIEEEGGQRQFIIKGDRNDGADPEPVLLLGSGDRVVHRVPLAGYLIHFVRTAPGKLLFLVLPALLLGGIILWEIWRPRRAAETLAPVSASAGPAPEAGPVTVATPTLEVVTATLPIPRPKTVSRVSRPAWSRTGASGVPTVIDQITCQEAGPVGEGLQTLANLSGPEAPDLRDRPPSNCLVDDHKRTRKRRSSRRKTSKRKSDGQRQAAA